VHIRVQGFVQNEKGRGFLYLTLLYVSILKVTDFYTLVKAYYLKTETYFY